jgi:hypothetical protein
VYIAIRTPIYYIACSEDIKLLTFKKAATIGKYGTMVNTKHITEAQKKANRKAAQNKHYEKTKPMVNTKFLTEAQEIASRKAAQNKHYEKTKPAILLKMKALNQTPERKETVKDRNSAYRKTDKYKAYARKVRANQLEALRLISIAQWRDFMHGDGDCDFTKDEMEELQNTYAAQIEAEVDRFLSTVLLEGGECAGLTFEV